MLAVFRLLRRDVPDEAVSDLELLRAANKLVLLHTAPKPRRPKQRKLDRCGESHLPSCVDVRMERRTFDILGEIDMGYRRDSDVDDSRFDSAYGPFLNYMEY